MPILSGLWSVIALALVGLILGAIAFRFVLQEKITLALFGISNYFDYTLKYYFFDNLYYAIVYSAFGIIVYLVRYNNYREQQRQAAEIENQKTQLSLLRSQMKPHFIFNTLNNVYALAHEKSDKALVAIDKLSNLLRYSLYEKREVVPLAHEWSFMESYIEIQELRLAYQPAILYDVPQQPPDIQILPFSLIPFIENLFKHGELRYAHTPARIHLHTDDTYFHFCVSNNIRTQEKDEQGGIGLENTKQRLALYYGSRHQLSIQHHGHSYTVALQIPSESMLKCIIIDDEPLALKLLSSYVSATEGIELLASYTNPITALQQLDQDEVDVILLDVQMPELTGVQFAKIVKGKCSVILTTAYEEYALQGYELDVVDYLLKPISIERFQQAIHKLLGRRSTNISQASNPAVPIHDNYIFVKSGYRTLRVDLADIQYLEGLSDYVRIQTPRESILTLENMKDLLLRLPEQQFLRVHKSYIIAIDKIDYIEKNRIVLADKYIPIGGTYQERFWSRVGQRK